MSTLIHTPECIAATEAARVERAAWLAQWPNHCKRCGGSGGSGGYENVGTREQHVDEYFFDPCEECSGNLRCPRCGETVPENVAEGDASCPHCGRENDDPGCPQMPEDPCACQERAWEEEEAKMWEEQP